MEKIFIIMINYNGYEDTKRCIDSIYTSNDNIFEIRTVIIDNNSDSYNKDKLIKLKSSNPNLEIIFNNDNLGFSKANNIGLKYINEKNGFPENTYIWFLNNDTLLNKNIFTVLADNLPGDNEVLYFEMRNFDNKFVNNGLNYLNPIFGRYSEKYKKNYIEYICGASIFIKNSKKIPFWNEDYFLYFEDVDYSLQLKAANYNFKTIDGVWYNHKVNGSTSKNSKVSIYRLQGQKTFMKKYGKCYPLYFLCKLLYLLFRGQFNLLHGFIGL